MPRTISSWMEYLLSGSEVKLQDPYHILLAPRVGLFVDYVSKNEFAGGDSNLLESHSKWVVDYWRKKADSVERKSRDDLSEKRKDLKVTELTIKGKDNPPIKMHVIGLASGDGVFVFRYRVLKQISTQWSENLLPPLNWCMRDLMSKKKWRGLNKVLVRNSEKI